MFSAANRAKIIIGLDCAATLSGIIPSEIAQIKKQLAKQAQMLKWIVIKAESFWVDKDNIFYGFEYNYTPALAQADTKRRQDMINEYDGNLEYF